MYCSFFMPPSCSKNSLFNRVVTHVVSILMIVDVLYRPRKPKRADQPISDAMRGRSPCTIDTTGRAVVGVHMRYGIAGTETLTTVAAMIG